MTASASVERQSLGLAQQVSTRVAFFIAGLAMGSWAPLVPYAKDRVHLDEASLGMLLLCLGMGSLFTMPVTGMLAGRFGCRIVITAASIVTAATLPLLAICSTVPTLAPILFLFGAGVGTVDVAVNIQAIEVEKASGRAMMSGFHGLYSVGGIVGASAISALLGWGATPMTSTLIISVLVLVLLALFARNLLGYGTQSSEPLFSLPRGKVQLIGLLCFIMFLTEGSMLDWGAVFLTTFRNMTTDQGGYGYAAFSIAMTVGRLNGDRIVQNLGGNRFLVLGGICAAGGLALAVIVPSSLVALLGFTLIGLGASNIVPVLFTMAGRQSDMPTGAAISAITTIGYSGILCGPAAIGFVAHATSLPLALGVVAVGILAVPLASLTALRNPN